VISESSSLYEKLPAHVFSLTSGSRDNPVFLLDIELGVVYWYERPYDIRLEPMREPVEDNQYDYAAKNEADWRSDGAAWAVADLFEVLKNQFCKLKFIPISSRSVLDVYATLGPGTDGMVALLQDIYRKHGWPTLNGY
jgi:hypothetical protein